MKNTLLILSLSCLVSLCQAQTPPAAPQAPQVPQAAPQPPARGPALDLALEAARTAIETCRGLDQKIGVSVIDSSGALKVLLAMDGAPARGVQNSTYKAQTALTFNTPTSKLAEQIKTDKALANEFTANPNFLNRAGGIPIRVGSDIIGAIGVGGARGSEKDEACALAGLEKVASRLK
jgi:uncharacterized protein GlcG (DUF336 family)